jgi:hypothetical protein
MMSAMSRLAQTVAMAGSSVGNIYPGRSDVVAKPLQVARCPYFEGAARIFSKRTYARTMRFIMGAAMGPH